MNLLDYLIPFAFALGLLILVHELGHYLVARRCGVKVLRFSIGFGKPLIKWRAGRDGTEWALGAFPLGGYVKMLDEREGEVAPAELHRAFNRQPVGRRFAIVAAGPLANFALAILLYWAIFVAGTDELRPRLALTEVNTPAAAAGIMEGDLVLSVDDEAVRSWQELRWALLRHALDNRRIVLAVRTIDDLTTTRALDLSGIAVDDGKTDLIARIGLKPWRPPVPAVLGKVAPEGAAARAGLLSGDEVIAVDARAVAEWSDMVSAVRASPGKPLSFTVRRDGRNLILEVTPDAATDNGEQIGRIGVAVAEPLVGGASMFAKVSYGPFEGFAKAVRQTWETSVLSLQMMGRMLTGEVSWKNLSGPVTIADYAGQTAQLGLSHYLKFVALISISLGVLNLLPIPVLDGGHLLYYLVEIVKGGPIPERIMEIGQQIGLVLLAMLMAFAFYNDITRLISG